MVHSQADFDTTNCWDEAYIISFQIQEAKKCWAKYLDNNDLKYLPLLTLILL